MAQVRRVLMFKASAAHKKTASLGNAVGISIAIRLKIQTKSSHKTHRSQLLRPDFVNLKSWIAINNGNDPALAAQFCTDVAVCGGAGGEKYRAFGLCHSVNYISAVGKGAVEY